MYKFKLSKTLTIPSSIVLLSIFPTFAMAYLDLSPILLAQANTNVNHNTKSSSRNNETSALSSKNSPIEVVIYPGQVKVIEQVNVERIAIGNGKLVTASVVANKQIVLLGEAPGVTSLYVWLKNGAQRSYEIKVTLDDAQKIASEKTANELRELLELDPEVKVSTVGDRTVLNGKYSNQETAEKVKRIADAYPQVLNLIAQKPVEVILKPEKMVLFEVKVIQVRKSAVDKLGIQWSTTTQGPTFNNNALAYSNVNSRYGLLSPAGSLLPAATLARPFLSYLGIASQITSMLNFLEKNGDLWTISEPRISTVSGGKSKIQIGGQIPIPVATGNGAIAIVYKDYGVMLEVQPTVDSFGNIQAKLMSEVSKPDFSNGAGQNTTFIITKTESEVSLKENETLVISGLLSNDGSKNKDGINGLSNLPLLGRLFSNEEFQNERTEMLLVVTPKIHVPNSEKSLNEQQKVIDEIKRVDKIIEIK